MTTPARQLQREHGSAVAMAVIILFILASIMLFVATSTMSSLFQTKRKTERATGMAAADSAIEKIRVALNAHVMDESDGFSLTRADLELLVQDQEGTVLSNAESSDRWGMSKVLVSDEEAFTVRENADRGYSFWQIVQVHEPRYHSALPSNLVVYIRAWATTERTIDPGGNNITTQPRVFRAEFRPGYFSDYQSITDGPFFTQPSNPTWTISGPIHTNGFRGDEWITEGKSGYDLRARAQCRGRARLTGSQNASKTSVNGCQGYVGSMKARQISLLNVDKTLQYMRERCGMPHGVRCFFNGQKEYNVVLSPQGVRVNGELVPLEPNVRCSKVQTDCGDEMMAAILVDGDINLSGTTTAGSTTTPNEGGPPTSGGTGKAARVTVATMRQDPTDAPARVWIEPARGLVGAQNPNVDTVGVISQGDIIMGIRPNQCGTAINIAGIAQSGSITMPRELVTLAAPNVPSIQSYVCPRMDLTGSFAMHGALISNMSWNQLGVPVNAGYQQMSFQYADTLYDNPPPFFATSYPWAMTKVKDADRRCIDPSKPEVSDPRCE